MSLAQLEHGASVRTRIASIAQDQIIVRRRGGGTKLSIRRNSITQDELKAWAMQNGWQMIAGHPSLTKPSSPKEAIVRMVLKATVAHLEAKKPAGKWEKLTGQRYDKIVADAETGTPGGLGLETIPGFRMLMQENRDRQVFAKMRQM